MGTHIVDPGNLFSWGFNDYGQLGLGDYTDRSVPTPIPPELIKDIISIGAGEEHSIALRSDGTVLTWGLNNRGQLGLGDNTNRSTPTPIPSSSLSNVRFIAAGENFNLAIKADGTVWTWGENQGGQLGHNDYSPRNVPTQINPQTLSNIVAVAGGESHSLAIKSDGTVFSWGSNSFGQLGLGDTSPRLVPTQIPPASLSNVVAVECGEYHSIALTGDGTVFSFGENSSGQLGLGDDTNRNTPTQINPANLSGVIDIAVDEDHCLAVTSAGLVYSWGDNNHGQLGLNDTANRNSPVQIPSSYLRDITAVAAGQSYSLALHSNKTVFSWGYNSYGQLGLGDTDDRHVPVQIDPTLLSNVGAIAGGRDDGMHTLAIVLPQQRRAKRGIDLKYFMDED